MKTITRAFLPVLVVASAVLAGTVAHGVELTQRIRDEEGFTIRLPEDWVQVPKDVLEEKLKEMSAAAPDSDVLSTVRYAFQLSSAKEPLTTPFILVQVDNRLGRVPESGLQQYETAADSRRNEGIRETRRRAEKMFPGMTLDVERGSTAYDPDAHIVWRNSSWALGQRRLKMLYGIRLTEKGWVGLFCVGNDEDYEQYAGLFELIVRSVEIDEDLAYKPRPPRRAWTPADTRRVADTSLMLVAFGIGVYFLAKRIWGRKPPPLPTIPDKRREPSDEDDRESAA